MISDLINRNFNPSLGVRLIICLAAFVVTAIPIIFVEHLSFVDYPNHLARFYIWQNLDSSEHLSTYYERRDGLHPYWAVRLFINGLSPLVGLDMAGRIFAIFATLMPAAGACCVGWVLARRVTLMPLVALAVSYNYLTGWGFHNFLFASGAALMVFALWLVLRSAAVWQRVAVIAILAGLLSVMHLLAAAILALVIFAWEVATIITEVPANRRIRSVITKGTELALILVLPALFYLTLDAGSLGDSTTADGGLLMRFVSLVSPFVLFGTDTDLLFSASPLLLVMAAVGAGIFKLSRHAAILLGVIVVATLVAPFKLFGVAINWRIPLFAVVLVFALASAKTSQLATRNGIAVTIAILILLRIGDVTLQLRKNSKEISELRSAGEVLEHGSRVLTVFGTLPKQYFLIFAGDRLAHYAGYLVPSKDILFPLLFPYFDIDFRAPYSGIMVAGSRPVHLEDLNRDEAFFATPENRPVSYAKNWRRNFDYLLVFGSIEDQTALAGSEPVHQGSYFQFRRINQPNQ